MPGVVSPPSPPSRPACHALGVAGRPVRVSLALARWYAIPCDLCVPPGRSGCPPGIPCVSFVCVSARTPTASAPPPPPPAGVARALRAVPVLGAGRAVSFGPCPSALPAPVPCSVWFLFFCLFFFLLVCWRGFVCPSGSCGGRRLGLGGGPCSGPPPGRRGPAGGRGDHCHCLGGGVRAGVPVACGSVGGGGGIGGDRAVAPLFPLWEGLPVALCSAPLSSPAHPFPVYAFSRGRGAAPCAGCGLPPAGQAWPEGGGGGSVSRPSGGVARGPGGPGVVLPRSVPLPSLGGQHCGRHRRRSGHGGAAPILLRFVVVRRPRAWPARWSCALVRVCLTAATPAGAGSGGCGGALRAGPAASPSRVSRSFLREGGRPLVRGGGRGSAPPWPAGRGGVGGRGEGGPRRCSLLLRPGGQPVAPGPVPLPLRRTPPGNTRVARTVLHFAFRSADHWWGSLCGRWMVTCWPHVELW